ncbi:hypothetical protein [Ralstonia pseudosolanacearum]|nr:hypothetical protein [Ralstonia pseudosolanacearum]
MGAGIFLVILRQPTSRRAGRDSRPPLPFNCQLRKEKQLFAPDLRIR